MKEFIKNKKQVVIRILIFILFVLPSIILSYLALFRINVDNSQGSASVVLMFIGLIAMVISKLSELETR